MAPPPPFGANSAAARDIANVLHPYTDLQTHQEVGPMVVTRGKGVRVWDDTGKDYIESVAGLWCASLGFDNERLVQAAVNQMRKLPFYHAFTAKSHEPLIDLSEMLIQRAPVPMSKVFFANSGSEANDSAIKMIWYFNNAVGRPDKKKIIGRLKGYHGITMASALADRHSAQPSRVRFAAAGLHAHDEPAPLPRCQPGESEEAFASRCAEELEKMILAEGPDTVAAMWAEPVMGAGGVIVPPRTVLREDPGGASQVRRAAGRRRGDLRLLAHRQLLGQPDAEHAARHHHLRQGLSASYLPISAVMVNDRVFQGLAKESHEIGTFGHGFTYSGHPVPAAVAIETLKIYDEMNIGEHVRTVGAHMQKELRRRFAEHPAGRRGPRRRPDRRRSNWWPTRRHTRTSNHRPRSAVASPS